MESSYADFQLLREPLYEQVANRILQDIVSQRLPVGARLPSERQMSEQFGVSRVVIREAMKVLVKGGVITVEPGSGTYVADRVRDSLLRSLELICQIQGVESEQLWEVRTPLEIVIAKLAAVRATAEDIQLLEEYTDGMESNLDNLEGHRAANESFHLALAASTKNELFPNLIQPLVVLMKETRILMDRLPDAARIAVESHRKLIEAIKRRDPSAAEQIMREHMDNGAYFLSLVKAGDSSSPTATDGLE
jgi:DNA-binding FadR family transcriptional regulator